MSDDPEFHVEINVYVRAAEPGSVTLCRREFERVIPLKGSKNEEPSFFKNLCDDSIAEFREEAQVQEMLIIGDSDVG